MSDPNDSSRIKMHLRIGIFFGVLAGLIQGLAEALFLAIRYSGFIFGPQDIYKSHLLRIANRIPQKKKNEPIRFILDSYLGPHFIDKLPLILNLTLAYVVVGLITGVVLGLLLWIAFKVVKKPMDAGSLSIFYLSLVVSFGVFMNLILWLDRKDLIPTFSLFGLLINLGLIICAFLIAGLIYKLICDLRDWNLFESKRTASSAILTNGSKIVFSFAGLIIAGAMLLNLLVLNDSKRATEIFAAQAKNESYDDVSGLNNRKDVNVILISIDSLRADHLSCYGYHQKTSPNIDRLAKEGILFSNAFSNTSWTLPAHISMLTSMYSESHGVITDDNKLDENRITLAEMLKEAGYSTAAFVSGPYLNSVYGYSQGFDLYDDKTIDFNSHRESHQGVTSPKIDKAIQEWLRDNYQKKFFLFLHYWDVHYDYAPPAPYDAMFDPNYTGTIDSKDFEYNSRIEPGMDPRDLFHIIALYDGEIAFIDKYIGELLSTLKQLGVYDKTLIILTADHGDEFFEHGRKGHRKTLYDEVLHVPLIFKFPPDSNLSDGGRVEQVVSIIDIMPTILNYVGLDPNNEMQGRSLLALAGGHEKSTDFLVYSRLTNNLVAVRSLNSKLIHHFKAPRKEFYDLLDDPKEKINLFDESVKTKETTYKAESYLIFLLDWLNAQRQIYRTLQKAEAPEKVNLTEPMKEQLKSLGYVE